MKVFATSPRNAPSLDPGMAADQGSSPAVSAGTRSIMKSMVQARTSRLTRSVSFSLLRMV